MRHWTDKTTEEARHFFPTLTEAEIRRRQDIAAQQIRMAYDERNDDALADLQAMERELTHEMMRRITQ